MTAHGVFLVVRQEFQVRLRTGRWRWLLASWVVVIAIFTSLLYSSLDEDDEPFGVPMFGGLMLFVLSLVLVISPALTAQSINGDRERGTLATLQVTRLTAADIAVGKLLAGWAVGLGALALTLPFVGWALAEGGVGPVRAAVVLVVVSLLIGVICAVSQGLSALLARSITSALLSYVTVFALTIGTLVAFGLAAAIVTNDEGPSGTRKVWWMLAPNPFVVLADATPQLPPEIDPDTGFPRRHPYDPLGEIGREVRALRNPATFDPVVFEEQQREDAPVWPYGLGFDLALGTAALVITIRRLRTPARTLPRGIRVG